MNDFTDRKILLVDDTKTNIDILVQALHGDCRLSVALSGQKALEFARASNPDLILLDVVMPGLDGFAVCRELKADLRTRDIPIIFITAVDDPRRKTQGLECGAVDYITKPFEISEVKARVRTHLSLKIARETLADQNHVLEDRVRERTLELEKTQAEVIYRLGLAAEYRDMETGQHIRRMSEFCRILGRAAGIEPKQADLMATACTMHDVGKIGIPDHILLKPGKLTPSEWEIMKTHCDIGRRLLAGGDSEILRTAEVIAGTHHERWDGTGYPQGLAGEDIPLAGRIACICDVFDALISKRPYKEAWPVDQAMAEIRAKAGTFFDPRLAALFEAFRPQVEAIVHLYS
jgi:putative two-component system response regulator